MMDLAFEERADLAAYLRTLSPNDWHTASMCEGWSIKDVVAHVVSYEELGAVGLMKRFIRGWVVRANEVGVHDFASYTPEELVQFLESHLRPQGLTSGFGGMIALVDGTIHHQDIRRTLGHPRTVPVERMERILPLVPRNPRLGAGKRIKGLRLQATDVDWRHGDDGPEVMGAGEALLMSMAGRRCALDELSGTGRQLLAHRIQGQQHPS
ncbi:maleylpyruvate isomerase family mycothiol-dependent enzyme [Mycolicibacterium sp. BiH015]|uniref:maleylpyruvate isomerase family mycothiol-dependent enzyme n=1 Tax=Mycolicibacterium sp. BiH015 TaxID=3018808 RepID=UPI0022E190AB|nr:maleylpyruvate isomerase family mycothiol-dependent enzyme [Mycolicibacterium sp. BiH015]MDA2893617.1 maleylpyruvate isomerase family mycothiol-dependent enzyme [Mycolicibacterium sp. BiH015]